MTWYNINRSCGHTERVDIAGANRRSRDRKAGTMAEDPCGDCRHATYAAANQRAAAIAADAGLPPITGASDRQVAYAEGVRLETLAYLDEEAWREASRGGQMRGYTSAQVAALGEAISTTWRTAAARQDAARWWLDNRERRVWATNQVLTEQDKAAYRAAEQAIEAMAGDDDEPGTPAGAGQGRAVPRARQPRN